MRNASVRHNAQLQVMRCLTASRIGAAQRARWLFAAFAAIALVVILVLLGLPGSQQTSPSRAAAAQLPLVPLNAGLAQVQTVQGVFIYDTPDVSAGNSVLASVRFALSSDGDGAFDLHYRPDYAAAKRAWLQAKKANGPGVQTTQSLMQAAAEVRQEVVVDGNSGLTQTKTWSVNPFTGALVGLRYRFYRGIFNSGNQVLLAPREVQQVWLLSSELRLALAQGQHKVTVSDVTFAGRPAYRALIYGPAGKPADVALIDRETGLTLRVSALPGAANSGFYYLTPFHLEQLRVNQPIAPIRLVMSPDYRYAPDGFSAHRSSDRPASYGIDLGERAFPVADLSRHTSSWTLLPRWLPSGYRLQRAVTQLGQQWMWLTYRRGLSELTVSTAAQGAAGAMGSSAGVLSGFIFRSSPMGPGLWPAIGPGVHAMRGGAMAGWPTGYGASIDRGGQSGVGTATFWVGGNLPASVAQRVAASMQQVRPGPYLPRSQYVWQPWLTLGVAAIVALGVVLRVRSRRRANAPDAVQETVKRVRLPLFGLVLVAAGASLSWHQLWGAGEHFSMLGWREPLGVTTVALALLACAAAVWALAAPSKPPLRPMFLTTALGLMTLAAALLAVVYLPVEARFTTDQGLGQVWAGLSSLPTYLRGLECPAPGPGLYVSIVGACLIVVGGVRLRAAR
jgi:hypothetical protein